MPSYYRSDVPRRSPYRNLIAVVIILVVGAGIFWGVKTLWEIAHVESTKANSEMERAVMTSGDVSRYDSYEFAAPRSGDNVSCALILTVDDISNAQPELVGVRMLGFNESTGTMVNLILPPSMWVPDEDGHSHELVELFGASGSASVAGSRAVSRVSAATHVKITHALVLSDGAYDMVREYSTGDLPWPLSIGKLIDASVSDLDYDGMVEFLTTCHDYGLANTAVADAQVSDYEGVGGAHWNWVLPDQLNIDLGILSAAA